MGTGRRDLEPRPMSAEPRPSPPHPLLFQLLLPALAWVAGCCSVSCQHPGEAAEPLCLPAAFSQALGGAGSATPPHPDPRFTGVLTACCGGSARGRLAGHTAHGPHCRWSS